MNIIPINLDPGDSAARRIRPMAGLPAMASVKAVAQPMTSPDPSAMYNRRQTIARDRAREEEAARIRAEARDEARRVAKIKRRQDIEDDVRDRNRDIEDLDRIRTESVADRELEYDRGATERERAAERYKREVADYDEAKARGEVDREYQLKLRERADLAYQRELEEHREKKSEIKADRMMKLKEAYLGLMGGAESSKVINAQRAVLQNERTRYAQLNMQNKDEFAVNVIGHFLKEVLDEDSPYLNDEQRESARAMFKQQGYDLDAGGEVALLKLKGPKAQEMASSISMYGDEATGISKYQALFAEKQVENNRRIGEYDKMLNDLADEKTLTEEQVDGLKELYKQRIGEMGGTIDAIDPPVPEIEEVEESDDTPAFNAEDWVQSNLTVEQEEGISEMLGVSEEDLGDMSEDELQKAFDLYLDKQGQAQKLDSLEESSEEDDGYNSVTSSVVSTLGGIPEALKESYEAYKRSGGSKGFAEWAGSLAKDHPLATAAAAYAGYKGAEAFKDKAPRAIGNAVESIKKAPGQNNIQRALDSVEKRNNLFSNQAELDKLFDKNGIKPYKPMPQGSTRSAAAMKEWVEWRKGFTEHLSTEADSKIAKLMRFGSSGTKGKVARGIGKTLLLAEGIALVGDVLNYLGVTDPSPEQEELANQVLEIRKLQKQNAEDIINFKSQLSKQDESRIKPKPSGFGTLDEKDPLIIKRAYQLGIQNGMNPKDMEAELVNRYGVGVLDILEDPGLSNE